MQKTIVSLLPAATEMVCLLDLEKYLVGISDDSNFPSSVLSLPKITTTTLPKNLPSKEIDKRVKAAKHMGRSIFHIDRLLLAKLAPDVILTQELCPVCAPAFSDIEKTANKVLRTAKIISFDPHTINNIFENIGELGQIMGLQKKAQKVIATLQKRIKQIETKRKKEKNPSVVILEWLDPLMIAGHWVPEMVERAGGKMLLAKKGERSVEVTWENILEVDPDILLIAPCGFSIDRTKEEILLLTKRKKFNQLMAYKTNNIFLIDGDAYLTRPGPRIIEGIEIFSEIFYPQKFPKKFSESSWQNLTKKE